jgi:hypothetical protein
MIEQTTRRGGQLDWMVHPGQLEALQSQAQIVCVLAGTQSGKTSLGPLWLLQEISRRGQGDYIVATPTFPLLELKLLPEFKRLFEKQMKLGHYVGSPTRKFVFSPEGAKRLFSANADPDIQTQVFFGHAQDPDSLESATAKAAWLDEAGQKKFKVGSYQAIKRRLSIHEGRILITTTPYTLGWLKEMVERAIKDPSIHVVNFRSVDNPAFPIAEYKKARGELPLWKFNMFYKGIFERPAGLIYDVFDKKQHVVPAFVPPRNWTNRIIGLDFGAVNTAAIKAAQNPETGVWFIYAEYHAGGKTAIEHMESLTAGEPVTPRAVGGAPSEDNWRLECSKSGVVVRKPTISDVEVGINGVYGLLKKNKLQISDACTGLLDEIQQYSRVLDDNDEPTEQIEDKENYHRLDALRYFGTLAAKPLKQHQQQRGTYSYQSLG